MVKPRFWGYNMGWGGKGGGDSAPTQAMPVQQQQQQDYTPMIEAMMGMMEGMQMAQMGMMQQMSSQMPELPSVPDMPVIDKTPTIDWTEKQDQLLAKTRADYNVDEARRKGVADTVLTSPLLDEEDAFVTGSVLADVNA